MKNLPDFLIAGVGKGGTSSLFMNLAQHPRIQRPKGEGIDGKELNYFGARHKKGADWYADQFEKRRPGCLLFEATPSYISGKPKLQKRIKELLPDVKAIVILRNPTDRAWSDWRVRYAWPPHDHSIKRLSDPEYHVLQRGIYVDQIKRWHRLFPRERLLILRSEDYFADAKPTLKAIYDFLGIEEAYPAEFSRFDPWAEQKRKWGYDKIPDDVRKGLDTFYAPHNERLSEYLGQDWTWK